MNPNNTRDFKRLRKAFEWSRRRMETARANRLNAVKQFVGSHYSDEGSERDVPVNYLELAVGIYMRAMAARCPRVVVGTPHRELKPTALGMELNTNALLKEIDFETSQRRWALDAMFCVGILKVGMTSGDMVEIDGFWHDAGQAYADAVDIDDFVMDMEARRWEQIAYAGNRYRVPLVKARALYKDRLAPDQNQASHLSPYNETGDARVETLSRGEASHPNQVEPLIEVWDWWLPREQLVVTAAASGGDAPLNVIEWDGPEGGPFHRLNFQEVPNNVLPLPPVALWLDLHNLANSVFRKLGRQARRQKSIAVVPPGATKDGEQVKDANDGDVLVSAGGDSPKELDYGGPNQGIMAFFLGILKEQFPYMAGNLDTLGGLSPQAETLGQEEIVLGNASQRITDMQERLREAVGGVIEHLAWYDWTDPIRERTLSKNISAELGIDIPVLWSPEVREGDFLNDFTIDVEIGSTQHRSPAVKLQQIMQTWDRVILPALPAMQAQGMAPDVEQFLHHISRLADLPELLDLVMQMGEPLMPESGPQNQQAPVTTRNYNRKSIPQQGRRSNDRQSLQSLMGSKPQDTQ
jgi:hypothetical protein